MHRRLFLLFWAVLAGLAGGERATSQVPPTLLFSHLRTEEGLSSSNVWALAQDSLGYLWAGTESGLTRFDGLHCVSFVHKKGNPRSLAGTNVHHMLPAGGGNLWVGTQSGLSLYRRLTNDFISFSFPGGNGQPQQAQYVFPFFQDSQARLWLYLGARGAVATWSLRTGKLEWISNQSNGYLFAAQRAGTPLRQYVTRLEKGILIARIGAANSVSARDFFTGKNAGEPTTFIDQVVAEADTLLWLCADAGLIALHPATGKWQAFSRFEGRPVDANCAVSLNARFMLVGTAGEGLLLFDKMQQQFVKQYRHFAGNESSLSGNTIYRCLLDSAGNLFLSVANQGIDWANLQQALFTPALYGEAAAAAGITGNITALCPLPNKKLLCGTEENGLLLYDPAGKAPTRKLGPPGKIESLSPLPGGQVLVQSAGGFARYNFQSGQLQKLTLQLPTGGNGRRLVQGLTQLPNGMLLAATAEGLMELKLLGTSLQFVHHKEISAATEWHNFQFVAPLSDSLLLLQSFATNLYLISLKEGIFKVEKEIARTPFYTYGVALAGGFAYLATTSGLRRISMKEYRLEEAPEGITDPCMGILKTDEHTLWVSTTNGLYRYNILSRHADHFDRETGLGEVLFNARAFVKLPNGKLAAGGTGGISIFPASLAAPVQNAVPVALHEVLVNDKPAVHYNPAILSALQLGYQQNALSFSFNTIDFTAPAQNPISYQLVGYDNHALTTMGGGAVRYGQLPPGNYRFVVSASGGRQVLNIAIAPPWWQTAWARGGALLLLAGTVATGFWLRLRWVRTEARERLALTIRSGEEERRRIARDLHDDFGARLATLKLYLLSAGKDPGLLNASAGLIDGAIVELRRILRNLSPRALEENGLQAAVADLAESINQTGAVHCELDMQAFAQRLAPRTEYALYRAVQELIGNTLKHAGASQIFLSFVVRDALLVILYEDNGKGFDTTAASAGYGLQNLQTHVESISGTLLFDTAPGRGCAATIEVPLHKSNLL